MDKQTVVYLYNGTQLSSKKEPITSYMQQYKRVQNIILIEKNYMLYDIKLRNNQKMGIAWEREGGNCLRRWHCSTS